MSEKLRLFVGITIDDQVRQKIAGVQKQLRGRVGRIRWVPAENIHLTLKFLGSVEKARLAQITGSLTDALSGRPRIPLSVTGLGVFPNERQPRILWAGLVGKGLAPLVESVERRLELIGFKREHRPFQPHLTLGRWRAAERASSRIGAAVEHWQDHCFGSFLVTQINLFQSVLRPTGALYSVVQTFELIGDNDSPTNPQEQQ